MSVNLDEALALTPPRGGQPRVSDAAKKERASRRSKAQNMAQRAVIAVHRDEYRAFYKQAVAKVNAERGPLPE